MNRYLLGSCPRCLGDLAADRYDSQLWTCIQCSRTCDSDLELISSSDGFKFGKYIDTDYIRDKRRTNWISKHTDKIDCINSGLTIRQVAEKFNLTVVSIRTTIDHMKDLGIYNPGVVCNG